MKKFYQDIADSLSDREKQVLRLFKDGYTNAEIGEILDITESTVKKTHMNNIYEKFGIDGGGHGKSRWLVAQLWKYNVGV